MKKSIDFSENGKYIKGNKSQLLRNGGEEMEMYQRIRQHIADNGIVLKKVAERAEIQEKKFYRLVNGKSKLTVDEYERICLNGLGVEPAYFFTRKFSKSENTA